MTRQRALPIPQELPDGDSWPFDPPVTRSEARLRRETTKPQQLAQPDSLPLQDPPAALNTPPKSPRRSASARRGNVNLSTRLVGRRAMHILGLIALVLMLYIVLELVHFLWEATSPPIATPNWVPSRLQANSSSYSTVTSILEEAPEAANITRLRNLTYAAERAETRASGARFGIAVPLWSFLAACRSIAMGNGSTDTQSCAQSVTALANAMEAYGWAAAGSEAAARALYEALVIEHDTVDNYLQHWKLSKDRRHPERPTIKFSLALEEHQNAYQMASEAVQSILGQIIREAAWPASPIASLRLLSDGALTQQGLNDVLFRSVLPEVYTAAELDELRTTFLTTGDLA